MNILKYSTNNENQIIEAVKQALFDEQLVILPTDTVYGIMALVSSKSATEKLYKAKQRPLSKPTALLVHSTKAAIELLGNDIITRLADKFWPGPLTIVKEAENNIYPWPKIGVRVPDEPLLLKVLRSINEPLMASSANIAGEKAPVSISNISQELAQSATLAVDKGATRLTEESTVIELENSKAKILRKGPVTFDDIERTLSFPVKTIFFVCSGNTCRSPMAAALFNQLASENGLEIIASSAGVMALAGQKAAQNAIWLMSKKGIDLTGHRAIQLDSKLARSVDLILVMDKSHLKALPESASGKSFLLSEYASGANEDIFDPVGGDLQTYEACANLIEEHLVNFIKKF